MALSRTEVEEIALLARLYLEPDETERMQVDLGAILEAFSTIAAVDTTDVPPMTHAVGDSAVATLRDDTPSESLPTRDALAAAPKRNGDLIVVPAILPGSE